jgi:hypothetical protein
MPNVDEIRAAIKNATGDPESGAVADITPAIVAAVDALVNPTEPETNTKTKDNKETRIMTTAPQTRGETA